jgi:hypothetical protein
MIRIPGDMNTGLKVSQWLMNKGYTFEKDYVWHQDSRNGQIVVVCSNAKLETMIALKWCNGDET